MSEYLSAAGQVKFLIKRGMTFHDMTQNKAQDVLMRYTYLHKVSSYKHYFSRYEIDVNGEDVFNGLDFNDIYELQVIDHKTRGLLNDICLDVEYYFKVYLLKQVETLNTGREMYFYYDVVDVEKRYHITDKMTKRAKDYEDQYSIKMLKKFPNKKPIWVLNEYLSFGEVIEIYARFNRTKKITKDDFLITLLGRAKGLRNITVHNNQLFSTKYISVDGVNELVKAYNDKLGVYINPKIVSNYFMLNMLSTLYVYSQLAPKAEFDYNMDRLFMHMHLIIKGNKIFTKYPNEQVLLDLKNIYKIADKLY